MHEAQAGIDAAGLARREIDAAVAPVRKPAHTRLDPAAVAGIETQTHAEPALHIASRAVGRAALVLHDGNEPVAAAVAPIDRDLTGPDFAADRRRGIPAVAAAIGKARFHALVHSGIAADGSRTRSGAVHPATSAARVDHDPEVALGSAERW